jgi:hypothetical protein
MPGVPYTFATATTSIPLSQLDANFNTQITLGNTTVGLGNTVTTLGNLTLTNVTIASGTSNVTQNLANVTGTLAVTNGGTGLTSLTANYIPFGNGTSAFNSSANFQYASNTLYLLNPTAGTSVNLLNLYLTGARATGNQYGLVFTDSNSETNAAIWAYQYAAGNNAAALVFGTNGGTGGAGGISSTTERMRIDSAGNIFFKGTYASFNDNGYIRNDISNSFAIQSGSSTTVGFQVRDAGNAVSLLSMRGTGSYSLALQGATTQAGIGITFPATQSASSDANTLDDYEEGTWLPNVGGTATYAIQTGRYTKIGNVVTVMFDMNISSIGTGSTGTMFGLPFTSLVTTGGSLTYYETLNISYTFISCYVGAGGTQVTLTGNNATAAASIAFNGGSVYKNNSRVIGSITYIVS